ncbi:hypothetical protein DL767_007246 [Monosporascus sp. MG133]|nr:hypothetical protein DL767_007246 [Monosporascus sp. MG133]
MSALLGAWFSNLSLLNNTLTSSAGRSIAIIAFLALVTGVIKRRYFHPLSNFPGPWINSVSELPTAWPLAYGNQHTYYQRLHNKYGPVVRVAPDELSFIGPDAWEDIYGNRKNGPNMEKSPIFIGAVSPMGGQTGISLADNTNHSRQRRALAYPFSNTALLQQEPIIQLHVDKLIACMKAFAAEGKSVDFSSWYTYTTFDLIGDLAFAEPFGCLDQGSATEWSTSVINVFKSASWDQAIRRVTGVNSWLRAVLVKLLIPAPAADWRRVHFQNSQAKTLARLADGMERDHKDLIFHILKNAESRKGLTQAEIIMNMVLLVSAGTETTASLLTGWTLFICTNPRVYERLVAEIRGAFVSDRDITWETVKDRVPYLDATINEALRLFSPAVTNQQRIVPPGGATIDGHYVPPGMTAGVAPWVACHSPLNFCDPDSFVPERWLPGKDKRYANDRLNASQPFSVGPRSCIGKNLAFFEMRLIMSQLLYNFDIALDGDKENVLRSWDMSKMKVFQTWVKPRLWIRLTEVQRSG